MFRYLKALNLPFLLFIVPWTIYFYIVWTNALQIRPDGWYAAYIPHWGDGVAHISYMATFAYRSIFPLTHPLFLNHPFTYSFVADMIGGLMVRLGLPLWFAYNLWGFILSILALVLLYYLIVSLTKSNWIALLALNLFLLSGGIGFKYLIIDYFHPDQKPVPDYFFTLVTQRADTDIVWLNTIVGELIPQRAFLLALPLGAILLIFWHHTFILRRPISLIYLFITGVILGLMPIIHPHTAMFIGSTLFIWVLPLLLNKPSRQLFIKLVVIGVPAFLLGLYLTKTFIITSVASGFFQFYPGWIARSKNVNWLLFWWNNWGLFLPAAILGYYLLDQKLRWILLPGWVWFFLTNLILFQPYDWDNSKLLTWVYLFFTISVLTFLKYIWKQKLIGKFLSILLFIVMILSGSIDVLKMLDTQTYALQILNNKEIALGNYIRDHTPPESIILTSTTHRNWVPIITGRQILCGYLGWMWTYGIKADERVADIRAIYTGSAAADHLIKRYHINYIVLGPEEKYEFEVNEDYFSSRFPILTSDGTTTVYQVAP